MDCGCCRGNSIVLYIEWFRVWWIWRNDEHDVWVFWKWNDVLWLALRAFSPRGSYTIDNLAC